MMAGMAAGTIIAATKARTRDILLSPNPWKPILNDID